MCEGPVRWLSDKGAFCQVHWPEFDPWADSYRCPPDLHTQHLHPIGEHTEKEKCLNISNLHGTYNIMLMCWTYFLSLTDLSLRCTDSLPDTSKVNSL